MTHQQNIFDQPTFHRTTHDVKATFLSDVSCKHLSVLGAIVACEVAIR